MSMSTVPWHTVLGIAVALLHDPDTFQSVEKTLTYHTINHDVNRADCFQSWALHVRTLCLVHCKLSCLSVNCVTVSALKGKEDIYGTKFPDPFYS